MESSLQYGGGARLEPDKKERVEIIEEEDYDDEEEAAMTTFSRDEEEYLDFLEHFGHIDFTFIEFTPTVQTIK